MENLKFLRQQDAINQTRLTALGITVIGAGAIGSTTCVFLGKMGACGIQVWDADSVEEHNWSNQLFRDEDIGKPKVAALAELMEQFAGHTPNAICQRYENQPLNEVVISAVDSMQSRKEIWHAARDDPRVRLLIDPRMGLETLVVHTVRNFVKKDRVDYTATLYSDAEALQEPCTARSICYTPLMAASVVCNLVKRYVNDEAMPHRVILDLTTWTLLND